MRKGIISAILLTSMLAGCSNYPAQQVVFDPTVQTTRQLPDIATTVIAYDLRPRDVIGFRSPNLNKEGPITSTVKFDQLLANTARDTLTEMGISRFGGDQLKISISLNELKYHSNEKSFQNITDLSMKLTILAEKNGKTVKTSYESTRQHKQLTLPKEHQTSEWLNEIFSTTLQSAFQDPKLLDFIQFR